VLLQRKKKQERESQSEEIWIENETTYDDFSAILWESLFDKISSILSENQRKWVKAYCLYGSIPSEIAEDEVFLLLLSKDGVGMQLLS